MAQYSAPPPPFIFFLLDHEDTYHSIGVYLLCMCTCTCTCRCIRLYVFIYSLLFSILIITRRRINISYGTEIWIQCRYYVWILCRYYVWILCRYYVWGVDLSAVYRGRDDSHDLLTSSRHTAHSECEFHVHICTPYSYVNSVIEQG